MYKRKRTKKKSSVDEFAELLFYKRKISVFLSGIFTVSLLAR